MYIYTWQCRNSVYMKFSPQATLKWVAQRMHSKVIRSVMHNANISSQGSSLIQSIVKLLREGHSYDAP